MAILNEEEYLRKAMKIWGMHPEYIDFNLKSRQGIKGLEKLYSKYNGKPTELIFDENGRLDIDKMGYVETAVGVSGTAKLAKWILHPDLSTGIIKRGMEYSNHIKDSNEKEKIGKKCRYTTLTAMAIADLMGQDVARYYIVKEKNESDQNLPRIYTPNFLKNNEELFSFLNISDDSNIMYKFRGNGMFVDIDTEIQKLEYFLYSRRFPSEQIEQVKKDFIKQCIVSKICNNKDEAKRNIGIVVSNNNKENKIERNVKMAPMYDLENCFIPEVCIWEREVGGDKSLKGVIDKYTKLDWCNDWLKKAIKNINNLDQVYDRVKQMSNIEVPEEYRKIFNEQIIQNINIVNAELEREEENIEK